MSDTVVYWLFDDHCICLQKHGYVGISGAFMTRLAVHQRNKRFPADFEWSIIFTGSKGECLALERTLRPQSGIGWNRSCGGKPVIEFTAEVREKMGASRRGKPLGAEHRAKLSAANKGRAPTYGALGRRRPEAEIAAIAAKNRGKLRSAEAREKMAAAKRGKPGTHTQPHSEMTKLKLSLKKRGVAVHSDEFRTSVSARMQGNTYTKGKPWSPARRRAQITLAV